MTGLAPSISLLERVEDAEAQIDVIKARLDMLQAFVAELAKVTRGKEFRIWNRGVWIALLDSRDQLIISLASWCKAKYSGGGLFGQVRAHHLSDLGSWLPKSVVANALELKHREDAFQRLFPVAAQAGRNVPAADDIECLRNTFQARIEGSGLMADRAENRAHPFEGKSGRAAMLDMPQVAMLFKYIEQLLNDLRLLCNRSTRAYHDVYSCGSGSSPEDLVDLVLCGRVSRMWLVWGVETICMEDGTDTQWWWQHRHAYYERIHAAYDKGTEDARFPLFNDLPVENKG